MHAECHVNWKAETIDLACLSQSGVAVFSHFGKICRPAKWNKLGLMSETDSAIQRLEAEIATASHNLREPLRMIRCYADLLVEERGDSAQCIERITHGAQRMDTLLNGMFECFQLSEHFNSRKVEMNLVGMNAVSRLIPEHRAAITVEELPAVLGDLDMLTEVFGKLVDNSLKFRGEQPPRIHIGASQEAQSGVWHFSLKDNGIGVEEEFCERCFRMFERLHRREIPGEGFGLAYCRRAIQLHGGRIWMESTPGTGTTIFFTLPAL